MTEEEREPMVDKRASARMNENASKAGEPDAAREAANEPAEPQADASPPEHESTPHTEADLDNQLAAANEKADQYYKNWQRSAADFINYKRRIEQEKAEASRFASAALVINLLPVYDDLERAVSTVDANLAGLNWVQGVVAIQRKFWGLLSAMGVAEIPAAGERFDPSLHEAVAKQPGDEGKVLHVVQKGYRLGERVIRPAMVIVGEGEGTESRGANAG
jgi:molecular chaperone GrpE